MHCRTGALLRKWGGEAMPNLTSILVHQGHHDSRHCCSRIEVSIAKASQMAVNDHQTCEPHHL